MSNFIVEHRVNGYYVMDTVRGVEDIDTSKYKNIIGIWVTNGEAETQVMEKELKEMRHARSCKPA